MAYWGHAVRSARHCPSRRTSSRRHGHRAVAGRRAPRVGTGTLPDHPPALARAYVLRSRAVPSVRADLTDGRPGTTTKKKEGGEEKGRQAPGGKTASGLPLSALPGRPGPSPQPGGVGTSPTPPTRTPSRRPSHAAAATAAPPGPTLGPLPGASPRVLERIHAMRVSWQSRVPWSGPWGGGGIWHQNTPTATQSDHDRLVVSWQSTSTPASPSILTDDS